MQLYLCILDKIFITHSIIDILNHFRLVLLPREGY